MRHLPSTRWLQTFSSSTRSTHNVFLNPSAFYHPGQENRMVDDTSHIFEISDTLILAHMSTTYLQPQISWRLYPPPPQLLSCVISTLCRKLCELELIKMRNIRVCTGSGSTSVPPCRSALLSKIHPFLESRSYKYTYTGSVMPTTPSNAWTYLGKSWFLRRGRRLWQTTS